MAWYNRHKGLAGAAVGAAAGSVVPVIGTFIGGVAGAIIGPLVIEDERDKDADTEPAGDNRSEGGTG